MYASAVLSMSEPVARSSTTAAPFPVVAAAGARVGGSLLGVTVNFTSSAPSSASVPLPMGSATLYTSLSSPTKSGWGSYRRKASVIGWYTGWPASSAAPAPL